MATATPSTPVPSQTSLLFARAVISRLALWPAMRVAVDNQWGGPDSAAKRTWLASLLVDAFETEDPTPDAEYVALALLQAMEDEFDAVLEDGSADAVARDVVQLWGAAAAGNVQEIASWEARAEGVRGKKVQVEIVQGDEEEWEDEGESESDDEAPQLVGQPASSSTKPEPVVDEDGFTLVQSKGKGRR
ncbi:hypothetical protein BV25DRAFT_1829163 [Artomyces pyxidatus]|uniref:Uncharacterized protein n=1 Tax=Artomyces pyxidatus TaxID=48021 RepID=A0ACB8SRZ3_9AGAM|nr:hypothetical protein BV25DRAFT_1829163 [Artomyces pyxidatus]